MTESFFFDANCLVGARARPHVGSIEGPEAVLDEAWRCGIDKVLAYHALAKEWSPELGNAALTPIIATQDRVVGCWIAEPAPARDSRSADGLVDAVIAAGFRVVRVCPDPADHAFDLRDAGMRSLVGALANRRVPLIVDTSSPDWRAIAELAAQAPLLPVIISGLGYRHGRTLASILTECPNVALESSTFVAHGAIEEIVGKYGPHRVIFGTNAPIYSMGAAIARIAYADISEEERRLIAGHTLLRLIEQVQL